MNGFPERMEERAKRARSRLVVALDFYNIAAIRSHVERALELLEALAPYACAFKLNHHLLLPHGLKGLSKLTSRAEELGVPLIADIKLSDVGMTNRYVAQLLASHGFSALIASPLPGRLEGLDPLTEVREATGLGILLLAYMSHRGAEEVFARRLPNGRPLYHLFVSMAKELRADGVIVGATRPEHISEVRRLAPQLHIYSPGIGPQGGSLEEAIKAGADFVIMGRQVLEGPRLLRRAQEVAERSYMLRGARA